MSVYHSSLVDAESDLQTVARRTACFLPVLIIGYSALIDPLINFDPAPRVYFGGLQVSAGNKSTIVTKLLIPALFLVSCALAMVAPPKYPRALNLITGFAAAFLCIALASSVWSASPSHTATLAVYQIILCGSLFLAIGVGADAERILRNLFWLFAVVVLINLVFAAVRASGPIGHQGIYTYKNTLGSAAGCACVLAAFRLHRGLASQKIAALATFLGAAFLLVISQSKTGLGMALIAPAIAICWWGASRFLRLNLLVTAFVAAVAIVASYVVVSRIMDFEFSDLTMLILGDDSFTGRTRVWSFVSTHIAEAPVLGHGYRGFWGIGAASPKLHSEIEFIRITGSSHNGFMDTLLDLGWIGLSIQVVFLLAIISACGRFTRNSVVDPRALLAIVLFVVGRNMMESVIFWSTFFDNLLLVSAGFLACLNWSGLNERRQAVVAPVRRDGRH